MVDAFVQLLLAVGQVRTDAVGDLPTEIGAKIFRYLDSESLVSAAGVNRRWSAVCKGDPILRRRIYKKLYKDRKERIQVYRNAAAGIQVTRKNPAVMFGQRNDTVTVTTKPVQYEATAVRIAPRMKKLQPKRIDSIIGKKATKKTFVDVNNNVCNRKALRM